MNQAEPATTFRGLPLTPEQDSEIRHYIHTRERCGKPWDNAELRAMLADMLDPPELDDDGRQSVDDSMRAEHATALDDTDPDDGRPPFLS